ncbi:hypothetical protein M405DRAFT_163159 [Rhizopogon salebrosus TDB-379]|nr:hypothetical protein M405DRAFT_163159 [Rhizopogon salebrosus TDB-379]
MPLLRIIRASGNPIQYPNTFPWPSLRTLYVGTTRFRLNIDNNQADRLKPGGLMPLLRNIRVRGNPIPHLKTAPWPSLRTLYVDTTRFVLNIGECIPISTVPWATSTSLQIITKWIILNLVA